MKPYDSHTLEPKWQSVWNKTKLYAGVTGDTARPKYYMLTEFPYPSGAGLHAGHAREYTLGDVISRYKRMQGFNVLFPMGWDAFGLPTENYAIKNKIRPQDATAENVKTFVAQMQALGLGFDWDRAVNTTDPSYYKWTQWLFLKFLEKGLAYQDELAINWCPKEKTGLANEEVVNGVHERCGTPVEKKFLKQWVFRITDYADRLVSGLKSVDYPSRIADQQINWIGRSEGAEIIWALDGLEGQTVTVYTTRPDTLFGATFLVVSPELADRWIKAGWDAPKAATDYIETALRASELSRQEDSRAKTGVNTDITAIHPLSGEPVPVWVADYVLGGYGTGAIMAVPAHDERDFAFAKAFNLPIQPVVQAPKSGKTALILHGTSGHGDENWTPYLRSNLEAFGYEVITPSLPDPDFPTLDGWLAALKPYAEKMTKDSLIIGHSSGGPTAEHFILENNLSIDTLLMVAPTFAERDWDQYYKVHEGPSAKYVHDMSVAPIDWTKLAASARQIQVFASDNDPYIPFEALKRHLAKNLPSAQLTMFENKGHISINTGGVSTLPEAIPVLIHEATIAAGPLVNSGEFDGLTGPEAKHAIVKALEEKDAGKVATKYKLRDWIFSRQHYWGEPIPVIHCATDGVVPVPVDQLPVTLPDVENYEPTDTGQSPLAAISDWVNVECPKCGGPAKRETDTMPNWAGSSWYYLRYMDAQNDSAFASAEAMQYWGEVDLYLGGMEHTTLHLLYSRFWHQFLYDQGLVPNPEPYAARRGQGIVLAADGRKMSKSIGNVINPTDIIATHGADTLRLYILFMAPYDESTPWSEERLNGSSRFIYRVWGWAQDMLDESVTLSGSVGYQEDLGAFTVETDRLVHKTIKKVHDDLGGMRFNTAISALMELVNFLSSPKTRQHLRQQNAADLRGRTLRALILLLSPFTPHLTEELWHQLGESGSVHTAAWPKYEPALIKDDVVTIVVQVNGKVRANLAAAADSTDSELTELAQADPGVAKHLAGQTIVKTIVVPRKLVNFVAKPS